MADVANMDIVIGSKIDGALDGFHKVEDAFMKLFDLFKKGAQDVISGAAKLGNVIGGLGEAIGTAGLSAGVAIATSLFLEFATSLVRVSHDAENAAKAQKDYNDAMAKSIAPAQAQITELNSLLAIARDTSESLTAQKSATNELIRLHPELASAIKTTGVNSDETKKAVDKLTESLLLQAQAAALNNLLTKAYEELAKKQNANLSDFIGLGEQMKAMGFWSSMKALATGTLDYEDAAKGATVAQANQNKEIANTQKVIDNLLPQIDAINKKLAEIGGFKTGKGKTEKDTKTISDVLKDLQTQMKSIDFEEAAKHVDLTTERISVLTSTLKKLVAMKAPIQDIVNVIGQIGELKAPIDLAETQKNISKQLPGLVKMVKKDMDEQFKDLKGVDFFGGDFFEMGDIANDKLKKRNKETADEQKKHLENIMRAAGELQNVFQEVFTSLAEGGQNAIKTLIHSLEQLIIKLASAAAAAALITAFFPGLTNAKGEAMGFMGIFKGLLGFQHGGIIMGPTMAMVGERGPEVIFPLDKLRDYLAPLSASGVVVLETRVRGNDIWLSQARTNGRRGRTY